MNPFDTNLIERKLVASPNFTMLCWDLHTAGSSYQQLDTKSSASWLKYIFLSAQGQAARKIHVQASASKLKKWPDLLFSRQDLLAKVQSAWYYWHALSRLISNAPFPSAAQHNQTKCQFAENVFRLVLCKIGLLCNIGFLCRIGLDHDCHTMKPAHADHLLHKTSQNVGKMITKQGASQQAGEILLPDRTAKNPAWFIQSHYWRKHTHFKNETKFYSFYSLHPIWFTHFRPLILLEDLHHIYALLQFGLWDIWSWVWFSFLLPGFQVRMVYFSPVWNPERLLAWCSIQKENSNLLETLLLFLFRQQSREEYPGNRQLLFLFRQQSSEECPGNRLWCAFAFLFGQTALTLNLHCIDP